MRSYAMLMQAVPTGGSLVTPGGPPSKLNAGQQLPSGTPPKVSGKAAPDAARPGSTASGAPGTAGGQATNGMPATANKGQPAARGISAPGQGSSVPAGPLSPGTQHPATDAGSSTCDILGKDAWMQQRRTRAWLKYRLVQLQVSL